MITATSVNLHKFLASKGAEMVKDGIIDSPDAEAVVDDYRETVSEGSGQYDVQDMARQAASVAVEGSESKWLHGLIGDGDQEFTDTIYYQIVLDAAAAQAGPAAVALTARA